MAARGSATKISDRVCRAQGIVSIQAHCSMDRALALIENTALMTETTLEEVADEVLGGRARFDIT